MTEANICQTSNSEEIIQSPNGSTSELNGKQSQSHSTDCTSTSGDENENSSHSDVDCQENSFPTSDEIDYLELVRRKDDKIKTLEAENRNLRKICGEMTNQHEARTQELVQELDRHVEIIENLQTKVSNYEQQIEQQRQQLASVRQQLSRRQNSHYQQQQPPPQQRQQQHQLHTKLNKVNSYDSSKDLSDLAKPIDPDDVCAALNTFVQKNRNILPGLQTNTEDEDPMQANLLEYLNAVMQNGAQFDNDSKILGLDEELSKLGSNNVLSLLLDSQSSLDNINLNENGCKFGNKSKSLSATTVRDYVNSAKDQFNHNYSTSLSNTSNLSNGATKTRFSQQISSTPANVPLTKPSTSTTSMPIRTNNNNGAHTTNYSSAQNSIPIVSSSSSTPKPFTEEEMKIINEMQERVSQNVARLGNRPLNTMEIAKQCKRLMVAYNIGQRLFAKAVMCQVVKSQGSLSELLSKPRVWHKLTDKGREAFRRIFGWLSDDVAIELLCQLSPRRVAMPCDKIEHPSPESLLDTGNGSDNTSAHIGAASYEDNECLGTLLFGESGEVKVMGDDEFLALRAKFPQTNIVVTKTDGSPESSITSPVLSSSVLLNNSNNENRKAASSSSLPNNNVSPTSAASRANSRWRHDDIPREKIIGIFEAEKAKLREQGKQGVTDDNCSASFFGSEDSTPTSPKSSSVHSMFMGASSSASSCTGRTKVEPAPIVQEQLEKYPLLDTEEVVKQVKEYLSRHSISQRQFGENVLGLSQGSVSDLLARPKAWSMLTHKGREPFIRMKIFLDEHANDENPPPNLNSSVYNDEKLEGLNYGMEEEGRETPESDALIKSLLEQIKSEPQSEIDVHLLQGDSKSKEPEINTIDLCRRIKEFLLKNGISQRAFGEHVMGMTSGSVSDLLSRPKPWQALSFKGRESYTKMANFLNDERAISTLRLNASGTGTPLNRSSLAADVITVRDLLTTTKTPDVYSAVAAANSLANNANNNNSNSVRRGATAEIITSPLPAFQRNSPQSFASSLNIAVKRKADDFGQSFTNSAPSNKKIPRFQRTIITDQQKEALLFIFSHEQRPSTKTIDQLSIKLGLSSRTVTNWFHNYRTRQKAKEMKLASEAAASGLPMVPLKPNPLQVADPTTKSWYKDLSELLAQNAAAAAAAAASGDTQQGNDSYFSNGGDNEFLKNSLNISCDGADIDSDFICTNGVELEDDDDEYDGSCAAGELDSRILTPKSTSSAGAGSEAGGGGCSGNGGGSSSQLDKVIARINNRLAASTS